MSLGVSARVQKSPRGYEILTCEILDRSSIAFRFAVYRLRRDSAHDAAAVLWHGRKGGTC